MGFSFAELAFLPAVEMTWFFGGRWQSLVVQTTVVFKTTVVCSGLFGLQLTGDIDFMGAPPTNSNVACLRKSGCLLWLLSVCLVFLSQSFEYKIK